MPHKRGKYKPKPGKNQRAALRAAREETGGTPGVKQEEPVKQENPPAAHQLDAPAAAAEEQALAPAQDAAIDRKRAQVQSGDASALRDRQEVTATGLLDEIVEWTERMLELHKRVVGLRRQARAVRCAEDMLAEAAGEHDVDEKTDSKPAGVGQKRRRESYERAVDDAGEVKGDQGEEYRGKTR